MGRSSGSAEWTQAVAAVVAVVLAGWAGFIGIRTLEDQQKINQSQLEINQLAEARQRQRYASRVAFWWTQNPGNDKSPSTLFVQNRSPVPIRRVFLVPLFDLEHMAGVPASSYNSAATFSLEVGDLPPCVVVEFPVPENDPKNAAWWRYMTRIDVWQMIFSSNLDRWSLDVAGLMLTKGETFVIGDKDHPSIHKTLHENLKRRRGADNCGEGG